MENDQLIAIETFCTYYEVEYEFVESLQQREMIETVVVDEHRFLNIPELPRVERIVRLYRDLDINLEGIDVIDNLLQRISNMDREIMSLKNRLSFYEIGR